jgi:hypothetical protein
LTNSEARKLLSDFSIIGRDILSITASKAADLLKPDQDKLDKVDDSAPQDTFVDQDPLQQAKEAVVDVKNQGQERIHSDVEDVKQINEGSETTEEKKKGFAEKLKDVRVSTSTFEPKPCLTAFFFFFPLGRHRQSYSPRT